MPERTITKKTVFKVPAQVMGLERNERDVAIAIYYIAWIRNDQRFFTSAREVSRVSGVPIASCYRVLANKLDHFLDHKVDASRKRDSLEITLACWPYDLTHGSRAETANGSAKKKIKYLERDLLGTAPSIGDEPLPEPLQELFTSQGKEEAYPNVWLTLKEYEDLVTQFGRLVVDEAAKRLGEWSRSLQCSKNGVPYWVSYRKRRDHAQILLTQCEKTTRGSV